MNKEFLIYGDFADRYDLHTPPRHYHHDHEFILSRVRTSGDHARLLDVGCGTGVFLEKAIAAGLDAYGLDPAPAMLKQACNRVPKERLILGTMQELDVNGDFNVITGLSWSFNYCADFEEAAETLKRCYRALRPGGFCIFQLAHAPHAPVKPGEFMTDYEIGPNGADDIVLRYRFWSVGSDHLIAEYSFQCLSTNDHFQERHNLHVADAYAVAECARAAGFSEIELLSSYLGEAFDSDSQGPISPFLIAKKLN